MRSIRLSLTVYVLGLLAAALGTVSLLAYHASEQNAEEKNKAAREVIQARFREDSFRETDRLDRALLQQARTIAQMAQFQKDEKVIRDFHQKWEEWNTRWQHRASPQRGGDIANGLIAAGFSATPASFSLAGFWSTEGTHGWWSWDTQGRQRRWWWRFPLTVHQAFMANLRTQIRLQPGALPLPRIDDGAPEYFQVNSPWGNELRSATLQPSKFPVDSVVFDPDAPLFDPKWDDFPLGKDLVVRRVNLLTPIPRLLGTGLPAPSLPGRTPRGRAPSALTPSAEPPPRPTILVQYACETTQRDAAIALLRQKRDQELLHVNEQSEQSLAELRNQLLLINACAFAAMMFGAFFLVRLGLSPLRRLSDAVSRVSEKDFHLQLGDRPLPHELRPIGERLSQALELLEHAFAREKQATADISHELRTPLAALMTTIEVTLRKQRSAEEYRDALVDCRASATQINQAVERLLALARLDAGVDRLRTQTIDAADLARQCVSVVRPLAEVHGLRLSLEAEEPALVQTDPDKLREILNNLLHNAIQYNRPEGSIDVAIVRRNGHLSLKIRDTGVGIPTTAHPHIFERFYRADPSRQSDSLHAGLGLAIVKGYLDLMGGSIEVESIEGQGSTFCVQLPA